MVGKTDGVLCPYWEKDLRYMVGDDRGCEEGGTGGKSAVELLPVRTTSTPPALRGPTERLETRGGDERRKGGKGSLGLFE